MTAAPSAERGGSRRWWLRAYDGEGRLLYDGTCEHDELNAAILGVEVRPDFGRIRVAVESRFGRLTYVAPEYVEPPAVRPAVCTECEMPEAECRRRSRVNGHDFVAAA